MQVIPVHHPLAQAAIFYPLFYEYKTTQSSLPSLYFSIANTGVGEGWDFFFFSLEKDFPVAAGIQ